MNEYSVKDNLNNWFCISLFVIMIGTADLSSPELAWLHGTMVGCMFAWACQIGYEWSNKKDLQNEENE